jgi:hypothetical protein
LAFWESSLGLPSNANASRILQNFGADVEHLSWFWLAAPITGMIVQPIVGHYSDRTWTLWGVVVLISSLEPFLQLCINIYAQLGSWPDLFLPCLLVQVCS